MTDFSITRVVFGEMGFVELTNMGTANADPAELELCQFPQYPNPPAGDVAPGKTVRVPAADLGGLNAQNGELAIYVIEDEYENPDAIAEYLQWGEVGHKRSSVAIAAGVWPDDGVIDALGATELTSKGRAVNPDDWKATAS